MGPNSQQLLLTEDNLLHAPFPSPWDSLGSIVDQDALPDGEGAVVPHQEEVKDSVCHPGVTQSRV